MDKTMKDDSIQLIATRLYHNPVVFIKATGQPMLYDDDGIELNKINGRWYKMYYLLEIRHDDKFIVHAFRRKDFTTVKPKGIYYSLSQPTKETTNG